MNRRDRSGPDMAQAVVRDALVESGLDASDVDLVVFGNATAGRLSDQGCIRGQTFLLPAGLRNAGIINVDNSCAGGASALHLATLAAQQGRRPFLPSALKRCGPATGRRPWPASRMAYPTRTGDSSTRGSRTRRGPSSWLSMRDGPRTLMEERGATLEQFAARGGQVASPRVPQPHTRSSRRRSPSDEVIGSPAVVDPLTRMMCSSFTDGAAAVVLTTKPTAGAPRIRSSTVRSGNGDARLPRAPGPHRRRRLEGRRHGASRPGSRRVARRHQPRGALRSRVARFLQARRRRPGHLGGGHDRRRQRHHRQPERRPPQPRPSAGRDRHRPGGRAGHPVARPRRSRVRSRARDWRWPPIRVA